MSALAGARRVAITATGVGVAAGCLGTWFEMSHAVICIPVVTLPPLALSQQVAVGSTVFGVAARQVLTATLYALEPGSDFMDPMQDLVDVNAAAVLAASGTVAAISTAALAARMGQKPLRRANGLFCMVAALFLQWRETFASPVADGQEQEQEPEEGAPAPRPLFALQREAQSRGSWQAGLQGWGASTPASASASASASAASSAPSLPPASAAGPDSTATPAAAALEQLASPPGATSELARHLALGAAAGSVLGLFGIGPAWLLAPLLARTAPGYQHLPGPGQGQGQGPGQGPPGVEERIRRTCCLAMVPPSLAAALRHARLGHVNARAVALPLATGAILGSAAGGMELADVPCEVESKTILSMLLFAYGCWCVVKA